MYDFPLSTSAVITLFKQHGISPTSQRVVIAGLLLQKSQHVSADDVLMQLRQTGSRVSKATLYNTLGLFVEKGLVHEVLVDPGRIVYDTNTLPHQHLYNLDTGELFDVQAEDLCLQQLPDLPRDSVLDSVSIIVRIKQSDAQS